MKKVSIIIPIYNVELYLRKCIDSVISQTYTNLEIILVDDGSTDKSSEICDLYVLIDKRIKVIHKNNGGLSSARNAGLEIATGDYVYFVDSDDFIDKDVISSVIPFFNLGNDIIVFGYRKLDSKYNLINDVIFPEKRFVIHDKQEMLYFIIEYVLNYHHGWETWNRIYKMDIIRNYNLSFFDNKLIFAEDLYFYICYMVHCNSIQIIDKCFYNYLLRDGSIMSSSNSVCKLKEFCCLSQKIYQHIKNDINNLYINNHYSLIHYKIMKNEIDRNISRGMSIPDIRMKLIKSKFCMEQYNQIVRSKEKKKYIINTYDKEDINLIKYYCKGNYNLLRFENKMLYLRRNIIGRLKVLQDIVIRYKSE